LRVPSVLVIVDQGLGLVVVGLQTVADRLRLVVVALDQPRTILVADVLSLRRVELDVVVVALLDADPPTAEPALDLLVRDVEEQHRGDPPPQLGQLLVERLRLRGRPREPVEDEAVAGVVLLEALAHHRHDHVVGNEITGVHVALRLPAELRAVGDVLAQHVPRPDVRKLEVLPQALGLGAFTGTGRTEQDQVQFRHGMVTVAGSQRRLYSSGRHPSRVLGPAPRMSLPPPGDPPGGRYFKNPS
jgi:hypothetical protein